MTDLATVTLPVATPRQARRILGQTLRPHWRAASLALTVLIGTVGAGLFIPPALGTLVDIVYTGGEHGDLTRPLVTLAVATLVQGALSSGGWLLIVQVGETALAGLRETVLGHALSLPQAEIERGGTGDLVSRVSNDVDKVSEALRRGIPQFLWSACAVVLTVGGLAALDWRFALAGLVSLPFYAWAARGYLTVSPPLFAAERRAEGERSQQLVETLGGFLTIQALLLGPRHLRRTDVRSEAARRASIKAMDTTAWFFSRIHLGELTGTGTVLVLGAWLVGNGDATVGEATAAALYFIRLYDPIGLLVNLLDEVQSATASLSRLVGILQVEAPARPGGPEPRDTTLTLRGVRFGYADGPDVLYGVDLEIRPGEHVALVGASGAGKTTLAALVAGIHEPRTGSIELGGTPLAGMSRADLARHITLISQEVHVFAGTLAEDLRLADADATEPHLREALSLVGAISWVDLLPDGLDTRVGTGGFALTPVQAQQIALARLVLRDPAVAVLDEATAEAGSAGARELEASMARVLAGRTALLVAHRLTTAAAADRVVIMRDGQIVEQGPPSELATRGGPYSELWHAWQTHR
ncbi:multidrug ABC transporter permease [Actinoplanes lobatus]|uniref:ATP-binding cassette subfamily C protein n=1 Tax=Actinoplanes lobatus TaxID=113568 RepID=A0A7W7MJ65_9ACTN|nr:ABC transporter ATP-binding protein [Actinoplanes lobatus]MBB4752071.1 ATP-binding cassette subfamily C protein [Actinoplanes lobatus]GGN98217.1 multidrug ABC transporter permease [Actinoplanes lobatus]GIE45897.1 multidrug ABC transporter permease [Actinoplanes lobatus]